MSSGQSVLHEEILTNFFPLNTIDKQYFDQLKQQAIISTCKAGEIVTKCGLEGNLHHYLISGEVEIRLAFDNRFTLADDAEQAQFPLEDNIKKQGIIRATQSCQLLIINIDIVDQLKAWSQSHNYEIIHLHESHDIGEDGLINDDLNEDWSNLFIQTPLASNLSACDLHKLFTALEEFDVKAGETIVQCNTNGEYFYIVQSGMAEVITDPNGAYAGKSFELSMGDYFGDEALVADTMRNASVVMRSDGRLGKLHREAFNKIVKEAVVKTKLNHNVDGGMHDLYHYLDVRLPLEFRTEHHLKSENVPISHLRMQLDNMDYSKIYFITPEGGRRSELATYLMRQAGFEAYCMVG